jgi:hypothetical protein
MNRLRAQAAIWLCLAIVAIPQPIVHSFAEVVEPHPACPSFGTLRAKLDQRIADLKPGLALREFTRGFASQALNFEKPTYFQGALFIVAISEGNATVTDELQCRFDASEQLISCRRECCQYTIREMTLDQYTSLAKGESREAVEGRLCSPSSTERQSAGRVATYYHVPLPVGHHDEGQTAMLVFEDGKLSSKGMSPYY